ncbi:MAG: hypothetical protein JF886_14220 [Candidatus Dormibacteraeota bacterium]|uniref:Uncharacterized protein n=1 Tax=Candidatus Aeolococcus gillhamiae TaxID=3127015 RepID=A0A934N707_9BACT|nr:hypothetical protein [Candidatus Dormibacteraeota bacterium]
MRITTDELAELPLAAAWFRADGSLAAATPEWNGAGADTVQYRLGSLRLVVATPGHDPAIAALSERVLEELDLSARTAPAAAESVRRCARAGLHLVMGRPDFTPRVAADVLATVATAAREENVQVTVGQTDAAEVRGGDTVALVLKQMAVNAHRHGAARRIVADSTEGRDFRVRWRGEETGTAIRTSRHPDRRERWGLALVRLAADALGATAVPAHHNGDGASEARFVLLPPTARCSLPLAALDVNGRVQRASRAWDEETQLPPRSTVSGNLATLVRQAAAAPGTVAQADGFVARRGTTATWVALIPRSIREYARDLVAGVIHEAVLLGEGESRLRVTGAAQALALALGAPTEMWLREAFDAQLPAACAAYGTPPPTVCGEGRDIPSAPLIAFLAHEGGGGVLARTDGVWVFRPARPSAVMSHLATDGVQL